jgi:hypothetical protein
MMLLSMVCSTQQAMPKDNSQSKISIKETTPSESAVGLFRETSEESRTTL